MCTESELTNAIVSTAKQWIGQITEFTVVPDERDTPVTFGFLLEIGEEIGSSLLRDSFMRVLSGIYRERRTNGAAGSS